MLIHQIARIENGLQKPTLEVGHILDKRNFTHVEDVVIGLLMRHLRNVNLR